MCARWLYYILTQKFLSTVFLWIFFIILGKQQQQQQQQQQQYILYYVENRSKVRKKSTLIQNQKFSFM